MAFSEFPWCRQWDFLSEKHTISVLKEEFPSPLSVQKEVPLLCPKPLIHLAFSVCTSDSFLWQENREALHRNRKTLPAQITSTSPHPAVLQVSVLLIQKCVTASQASDPAPQSWTACFLSLSLSAPSLPMYPVVLKLEKPCHYFSNFCFPTLFTWLTVAWAFFLSKRCQILSIP